MNEILINYIAQGILGGASGYITNEYAINMLFKEYTPLKLGGVIKKTRNEFIENISLMVENDIINKEKLKEILRQDEFEAIFEKLLSDFLNKNLYTAINSDKFSDIPGYNSSINNINKFAESIINEQLPLNLIIDNLNIKDFIAPQSKKIADTLFNDAKDFFENTNTVENTLKELFENKDLMFSEASGVNNIVSKIAEKFIILMLENDSFCKVLESAGFNDAVNESLNIFYDKKIKDFVEIDSVAKSVISYGANRSQKDIQRLFCSLFSYGKNLDKSIASIIDLSFEENFKKYLAENMPFVTEKAVSWITNNNMQIDNIIEDAIEEVIDESDAVKAKLLSFIKNKYFDNIRKDYSIVDKIIAFIEQATEPAMLSTNISSRIVEKLNKITISEIITEAENNNFNGERAAKLFIEYINKNDVLEKMLSFIKEASIREILPDFDFSAEKLFYDKTVRALLQHAITDALLDNTKDKTVSIEDVGKFLKNEFISNEDQIKSFIAEKIKNTEFDKNILKNSNVEKFLKEKLFSIYENEVSNFKDIELKDALDKLTVNALSEYGQYGSFLRTYTIKNTDTILKGSIKGIVSDNLNKLSDDEIVDFANEFIGKELKPIMLFGGILGIIAGLILAVFQNSSIQLKEMNAINMLTYSFVGFITNVIAINMIFKPYKKNKFLSKIPFFKNFSIGYIVKNQKSFAENTSYFIDNSLLSKKNINDLFDRNKFYIKNSFINNIIKNDGVNNLLFKNKIGIVSNVNNFIKENIFKNLNKISDSLYEIIVKINLLDYYREGIKEKLSSLFQNIKVLKNICNYVYSKINSDAPLKTTVSVDLFKNAFEHRTNLYCGKAIYTIENNKLPDEILKYKDKYQLFANKKVLDFNIDIKLSAKKINDEILSHNFRIKAANIIKDKIKIDENKTFGELFDGRIKLYIDKNLPLIIENLLEKIKKSMKDNVTFVSMSVGNEFKNKLNFLEKSMFYLMGGDELLNELVTKIMTDKIPMFLDVKKNEIQGIAANLIEEKFYKSNIEVLKTSLNIQNINELLDNFIVLHSQSIENTIGESFYTLYKKIENKSMQDILKFFKVDDLNILLDNYNQEINVFESVLQSNISKNKNEIYENIHLLSNVVNDFMNISFKELFNGVTYENIEDILSSTLNMLNENNNLKNIFNNELDVYFDCIENIPIGKYTDKEEFVKSIEAFINELLTNDEAEEKLKYILTSIIENSVKNNFNFIDLKTKNYFVDVFAEASVESLKNNLDEMLKSIEFDKIAKEEIEKMEPRKIHEMFNSFGEKYFRKLMLYGFFGFVFGINMYVGFALTGLKVISEVIKSQGDV